ncbi:hypothetical protein JCM10207_001913 [Rhodosporidiobolus poonsookiae]
MERKHVCILPKGVALEASDPSSSSSRFLRLPHPRTHQPALFLPYSPQPGSDGLLELQKVQLDADKQRCWFVENEVVSDGSISLFSPFDPVFLAIAYLSALPPHYLTYPDLWETVAQHRFASPLPAGAEKQDGDEEDSPFADDLVALGQMECVKKRMLEVCETQEHESTTMYRFSQPAALSLLKAKVDALAATATGVFGPLESTSPGEKVEKVEEAAAEAGADGAGTPPVEARRFPTVRRGLGKEAVGTGHGLSEEIQREARQKYAVGIVSNYLPPALAHTLLSSYSFPALAAFLSTNTTSTVLTTTYLPGRGSAKLDNGGAGDGGAGAAAKKRKAEASKGSRGVEALKKVNTKGMSSLKDLFGKQTAKAGDKKKK